MNKSRKTNVCFLWLVVFYLISCFYLIPLIPDRLLDYNSNVILGQMLIIVPVILYLIVTKGQILKELKFRRIGFLNTFLLFVFTYCMLPVVSLLNVITMMFTTNKVSGQLNSMNDNPFLLNIFLIAILPAFVEEFTFRGILYSGYRNSTIKRAMIASAFAFGLFHMNINQFCYAFFMGIVFVLLREATGSMHSSMIVHAVFNANSVILLKVLEVLARYVNKMAKSNESFAELADNLNKSANETVITYADYSLIEKVSTVIPLLFTATVAGIIGFFVLKVIAERCNRGKHLKMILCSMTGRTPRDMGMVNENEYVENTTGEYGGKIVDFIFILAVSLCVLMMVYIEIG